MPTLQGLVMAVDTCVKPESYENGDDDDDDEPIAYLRSKTSSQRHDGSSKRNKALAPNGRNSSSQEDKVISSSKVPAAKSTKASSSLTDDSKSSPGQNLGISNIDKKSLVESHTDPEDSDDEKPLCFVLSADSVSKSKSRRIAKECSAHVLMSVKKTKTDSIKESPEDSEVEIQQNGSNEKANNKLVKSPKVSTGRPLSDTNTSFQSSAKKPKHLDACASKIEGDGEPNTQDDDESNADVEDSDDEKPLNIMLSAASSALKCNSIHVAKGRSSPAPSSTVSKKMRASIKRCSEGLEVEIQQNDLKKKDNKLVKSPKVLTKRPSSDINNSIQSSAKKPKQVDAYVATSEEEEEEEEESMTEDDEDEDEKDEQVTEDEKDEQVTEDDDDDDFIEQRQKRKKPTASGCKSQPTKKRASKIVSSSLKKTTKKSKKHIKNSKYSMSSKIQPSTGEGQKWTTFVHNGVMFPPPYTPHGVKMLYNGEPVDLTHAQEEVATMFAVMKDTEYATKSKFIENFMNDWRVILGKNHVIKKFELCDFTPIYEWHQNEKEKKKQITKEEKKAMNEEKLKQEEKYMWAVIDGVKEKVGNFRVEPPGLFRGRGEHPKMGKLKKRILPSDITINIGKEAPIPECPIPGERWKEVKHDNTVTSIAYWNDPVNQKLFKYVSLHPSSSLKGQSDKEKYEKARLLKDYIDGIRANYTKDIVNKDITKRQIAVATYLIDKLALRAGNEKDDDEADTVGCCTLKVENVMLVPPNKLQFDFLGKDSIRYFNTVEVELPVYKAIGQFKSGKKEGEDIFDKLDTTKLNFHLKELMPGLTAKVFRTYNASITLDEMLNKDTKDGNVAEKIVVYQHANKEVAIICNHQRSVSKSHSAQMSKLSEKIDELKVVLDGLKTDITRAKKGKPPVEDADGKPKKNLNPDSLERKITQTNAKIEKMERDMRSKEDLKTVALGTSKINYLDPRISVAWCKRHEVPIEKIFNKSLLEKFSWAMNVDPSFRF